MKFLFFVIFLCFLGVFEAKNKKDQKVTNCCEEYSDCDFMDFDGFSNGLLGSIQFIGLHYTYFKFRIRFGPWKLILKVLVLFGHTIKMDFGVILTHGPSFLVLCLNLSRKGEVSGILQVQQVLGLKIYINTTRHMP